jgi:glutamine synthetase
MLGQWEFQIGFRGDENEATDILTTSDHMWISRWLLSRIAEEYNVIVSIDNKPVKGDWNGAGMHTNFSTNDTRNKKTGMQAIKDAIENLSTKHSEHVSLYGSGLDERLTGLHETCGINTFKAGVADRGCSIRIPQSVNLDGYGYLEDRRPGANSDPYLVAARLCTSICNINESVMSFTSWPRINTVSSNLKALSS